MLTEMERFMVGVHILAADHRTPQIGPESVEWRRGIGAVVRASGWRLPEFASYVRRSFVICWRKILLV